MDTKRAPVDWDEVNRRLDRVREAVERGWIPTPEQERAILRARAAALARTPAATGPVAGSLEVVEFLLATETYGVETRYVREVYPLKDLTLLPGPSTPLLGLVNVRGQVLPVVDLRRVFALPQQGLSDLNKIIIVCAGDVELGMLADAVLGIRTVPPQDIQPSLPTLGGIQVEFLKGVTGARLVVLDVERLLSDRRLTTPPEAQAR